MLLEQHLELLVLLSRLFFLRGGPGGLYLPAFCEVLEGVDLVDLALSQAVERVVRLLHVVQLLLQQLDLHSFLQNGGFQLLHFLAVLPLN